MKHSINHPLLHQLERLLAAHQHCFIQRRVFRRVEGLVFAQLFAFGRHTISQLLLVLGLGRQDWSAWYRLFSRGRFDEEQLARTLLGEIVSALPRLSWLVVGVDAVHLPRHSQTMPGTRWARAARTPVWRRGIERTQRFLHLAWLLPQAAGYSRALPLRFMPAFPAKAVASAFAPCTEVQAALAGLQWLRRQLDQQQRAEQPVLAVADGGFETLQMWRELPARTVLVARTATNRVLYALPAPAAAGRGRRRLYGARLPAPGAWVAEPEGWEEGTLAVRGREIRLRYRVVGPCLRQTLAQQPLWLIVVGGARYQGRGQRTTRRRPTYYLVNAVPDGQGAWELPLPVLALLGWLWQRWELETAHREMKSNWGIGQSQCFSARGSIAAVQFAVWSYALLLLAAYRCWGLFGGPPVASRWWKGARRWSFNTLWRAYRAELWGDEDFPPAWTASAGNWRKKTRRRAAKQHAVASSFKT